MEIEMSDGETLAKDRYRDRVKTETDTCNSNGLP